MRIITGALLVMMGFSAPASASTYVWKDPVSGFSFSFPDTWTVQTDDIPSTKIRVAGPVGGDAATCRVRAEPDGRLKIYPKRRMDEAVTATLDRAFWEREAAEYERAVVTAFYAPAGMGGRGDATAAKMSFVQNKAEMSGEMIGSIYGDMRYVISCSSKAGVFAHYAPVFAGILGSVELAPKYHPFATGYYRDFLADPALKLPRSKPGTVYKKNEFWLNSGL